MKFVDNYAIQARQAKKRFLSYDQGQLIEKLGVSSDKEYIYVNLLCKQYRLHRETADLSRLEDGWVDANTYEEIMTLLDLVCDCRSHRRISGEWKSMEAFGLQFHRNLLQNQKDSFAEHIHEHPEQFVSACEKLQGEKFPGGDMGYAMEVFDGLKVAILFWYGDEEFFPRLRYLWDKNALQYLRYETMYFALSVLRQRIQEEMQ